MRIALAQLNPTVGDLAGNRRLIEEAAARARSKGAELVVTPELALTGYPPHDLLERDGFVQRQLAELDALAAGSRDIALVVGAVLPVPRRGGKQLANAAVLLQGGVRAAWQAKTLLPTYDVFDENRYFVPADERGPLLSVGDCALGMTVCEDAWVDEHAYAIDPVGDLARAGAELVLNLSASPFHVGKAAERRRLFADLAAKRGVPIAFVNQVGGNDELVFDGGSFLVDAQGRVRAALPLFEAALEVVDLATAPGARLDEVADPERAEQLALGAGARHPRLLPEAGPPARRRDRSLGRRGFGGHGLARGEGARQGARARRRDAGPVLLGPQRARRARARRGTSASRCAGGHPARSTTPTARVFAQLFGEREDYGLAQQNIQARIRGAILMAISNAESRLVLATGNKSELSVGYCTLYGDTVGGLAVLGDVFKRDVYALARLANARASRSRGARSRSRPPRSSRRASSTATTCRPTTCSTPCSSRPSSAGSAWPE